MKSSKVKADFTLSHPCTSCPADIFNSIVLKTPDKNSPVEIPQGIILELYLSILSMLFAVTDSLEDKSECK